MAAVAERSHADILPDKPLTHDPLSVTMPPGAFDRRSGQTRRPGRQAPSSLSSGSPGDLLKLNRKRTRKAEPLTGSGPKRQCLPGVAAMAFPFAEGPRVRIRLPPAKSPCLAPTHFQSAPDCGADATNFATQPVYLKLIH